MFSGHCNISVSCEILYCAVLAGQCRAQMWSYNCIKQQRLLISLRARRPLRPFKSLLANNINICISPHCSFHVQEPWVLLCVLKLFNSKWHEMHGNSNTEFYFSANGKIFIQENVLVKNNLMGPKNLHFLQIFTDKKCCNMPCICLWPRLQVRNSHYICTCHCY